MKPLSLADLVVSPANAVLVFAALFVVFLLAALWTRSRRKPRRRQPYQTDADDFARIYRS